MHKKYRHKNSLDKNTWITLGIVVIAVAVLSSAITISMTGNVIKVSPVVTGTTVYTQTEIDAKLDSLTSQIRSLDLQVRNLTARLDACCSQPGGPNNTGGGNRTGGGSGGTNNTVIMNEGETRIVNIDARSFVVKLLVVSDADTVGIQVDNASRSIDEGQRARVGELDVYVADVFFTLQLGNRSSAAFVFTLPASNGTGGGGSGGTINRTGTLMVTSLPSGAYLFVDSRYRGLTPFTVSDLRAGKYYTISLRKGGYEIYTKVLNISAGNNSLYAILKAT